MEQKSEVRSQKSEVRRQKAEGRRQPPLFSYCLLRTASCLLGSAVCLLPPASCLPAEAAELKIGYVNVAKVFDSYERTKVSDAALERKGKQKETELQARMEELKKLRQNLELLNDAAREAKRREIEEKEDELQRFRTNTARDLSRERDTLAKDLLKDIQADLDAYAKANGFSLILDSRSLLYGEPARDVTDEVLAALNARAAKRP